MDQILPLEHSTRYPALHFLQHSKRFEKKGEHENDLGELRICFVGNSKNMNGKKIRKIIKRKDKTYLIFCYPSF
jgi:hypothetical protein